MNNNSLLITTVAFLIITGGAFLISTHTPRETASKLTTPRGRTSHHTLDMPAENSNLNAQLPLTSVSAPTAHETSASSSDTVLSISSIYPSSGPRGTTVTLNGSGFYELSTITITGLAQVRSAAADTFKGENFGSSTRITFTVPPDLRLGTYNIRVENSRAQVERKDSPLPVSNSVIFRVTPEFSSASDLH